MSDPTHTDTSELLPEEESVDRLLEIAGRRPVAPESVEEAVRRTVRPAWQAKARAHARRRRMQRWTLAAAAVLALALAFGSWRYLGPTLPTANPQTVATLELAAGDVDLSHHSRSLPAAAGAAVPAGGEITTAPASRVALRLADGPTIRIDADSTLRLDSTRSLFLSHGAVYVDTGSEGDGRTLEVLTPLGAAQDVGTQFEVRLLEQALQVQVREGEVEVRRGQTHHSAAAGSALTLRPDGTVDLRPVAAHGSAWSWILQASPGFELEGRSLGDFLEWVRRETGLRTVFADPSLERDVSGDLAHGSIAGLLPRQALDVVLPGFGLRFEIADGTITIERANTP